jgi:hypothetical protein
MGDLAQDVGLPGRVRQPGRAQKNKAVRPGYSAGKQRIAMDLAGGE